MWGVRCEMWVVNVKIIVSPASDDTRPQRSGIRTSGTNKFKHIFISVNHHGTIPLLADWCHPPHTDQTLYYKTFLFHFLSRLLSNGFYVGRPCELNYRSAKFLLFWYFPRKGTGLPIYFRILQHFDIITSSLLRISLWKVWAKFLSVCKVESFHPHRVLYLAV